MTWTYAGTAASARERIRDLVGDVDSADPQVTDEAIAVYAASEATEYLAAARIASILAARYARAVSKSVGPFSLSASDKAAHYKALEESLRLGNTARIAASANAVPSAGGISVAEKTAHEGDTDITQPDFKRGMHDHPGAAAPSLTRY